MNTFLKVLAGIGAAFLVMIVVIFAVAWGSTSGVAESADKFLALLAGNKTQEAYDSTAMGFKATTSIEEFSNFVKNRALDKYASSSWNDRSVENDTGRLVGSITTSDKEVIQLELNFVKEAGAWKIKNIKPIFTLPSDEELKKLTNDSMTSFAQAVKAEDFKDFYGQVSKVWQAQTTADDLKVAFKDFIEKKVDLSAVGTVAPSFLDKPVIDEQGILGIAGFYPFNNKFINFQLNYLYERPSWKLVGINVHLK